MADSLPWDDGHGDTKGWDRASIANRSAKPYRPAVTAADLQLPNEAGKLRALGLCAVCAFAMTFLYLGIPLYVFGLFVALGVWYPVAFGSAAFVLTAVLFVYSTHETEELRQLAREL